MTFNNVNRKGKNPREKRSISMAFRKRFWAGVKAGTGSVVFVTESARIDGSDTIGGGPELARIDG